jgi:hypothetical protein
VKKEVIRAGYVNARTIDFGWVTPDSDPFALPCIGISDKAGVSKALCQASGLWHMIFRTQRRPVRFAVPDGEAKPCSPRERIGVG